MATGVRGPSRGVGAVLFSLFLATLPFIIRCAPERPAPNIVLVVLDTLRKDAAGSGSGSGPWRGLTPSLDSLAGDGVDFGNAWATAPWTVPSHASIFTGLSQSEHNSTHNRPRLDPRLRTLAEVLKEAGYETGAVFSNPWLTDGASGLLRGFSLRAHSDIGDLAHLESPQGDQGGRRSVENAKRWFAEAGREKPFFLFVNLLEPHLPYDPPPHIRDRLGGAGGLPGAVSIEWAHRYNAGLIFPDGEEWRKVRELYGGDVAAVDSYLGELVDAMKGEGLYENTVLIVTSDHGENFGEHGLAEHQFSLHETLLAVPLVIRGPGHLFTPGERDDPVLLSDLYATILDCAGIDSGVDRGGSRSLLEKPSGGDRPLPARYAPSPTGMLAVLSALNPELERKRFMAGWRTVRVGRWRLTVSTAGDEILNDMESDPLQQENLAGVHPGRVAEMQRLLPPPFDAPSPEEGGTGMDEETRERLRSLGYIR